MSLGPGSSSELKVRANLSNFLLEQSKYVFNLDLWDKFLIWRYTLGSGSLNGFLIGINDVKKSVFWCYLTFKYYNYPVEMIRDGFERFKKYFRNPDEYLMLADDVKIMISGELIQLYIIALNNIIRNSPVVRNTIVVYKTSSEYPGLPDKNNFSPKEVIQLPFNSTTYDPQFNFAPFTSPESDCCMYEIFIEKGSRVLYIPSEIHAYPHEREILLPPGVVFDIIEHGLIELDYISMIDSNFVQTQDNPYHIGEVYRVNPLSKPNVKRKKMNLFIVNLK